MIISTELKGHGVDGFFAMVVSDRLGLFLPIAAVPVTYLTAAQVSQ